MVKKAKGLGKAAKKTKKAVRRVKMIKPLLKNRKRLGTVLKGLGHVLAKRL